METGWGRGGKRSLASGGCMRSSGSVQSEARRGPGGLLLSLVLGTGGSKRKQAEAAQKFAEVVVEKGTSSNLFPHM